MWRVSSHELLSGYNGRTSILLMAMQPWAQLLVHGIKRIEGRAWSSNHRGRVWIHATSARPENQTIRVSTIHIVGFLLRIVPNAQIKYDLPV